MGRFLGIQENRLDSKGRVSVPASFRATLASFNTNELILRPSHKSPAIEAWPEPAYSRLAEGLDRLDAFSDEHDALTVTLFASAHSATPDADGRIVLTDRMIAHAGLEVNKPVAFMGLGERFYILQPAEAERMLAASTARALKEGLTVPRGGRA
ncbi:division/cell wall cluster transcriptional repressor MraZ [Elioraea sp.]|jgi:MraZ protein|uniref:division/cell wall cluster transcriptional repressor MraZ n=1 Tax=Elioraea sp. TaxID=2185103 RepID=UPI0021DD26D4|nr:cell division/cell wall cluster transcriptional repressor MraZ [Elioraea sp.]GIX10429.1 MAG: transcriptional regulator MraZ [Elioraea sp.]